MDVLGYERRAAGRLGDETVEVHVDEEHVAQTQSTREQPHYDAEVAREQLAAELKTIERIA